VVAGRWYVVGGRWGKNRSQESGFRKYKCSGKVGGDRLHGKEAREALPQTDE
jgi:hypothetical protein